MTVYVRETMETAGTWDRQFAKELFRGMKRVLGDAGKATLKPLRMRTIWQEAVHRSKFGRSWKVSTPHNKKLVIFNRARNPRNKYYYYGVTIEVGRKPGRMPPPSHLNRWVQDKTPELVALYGVRGASFIVARSIAQKGIKPRPIMTAPKMQKQMDRVVMKALSTAWVRSAERARLAPKPSPKGGTSSG